MKTKLTKKRVLLNNNNDNNKIIINKKNLNAAWNELSQTKTHQKGILKVDPEKSNESWI